MSSVDELIEQAQSFSAQHRRENAASCLFNAADLILKQNEKLPQEFKRMSLHYELNALANIELLKESKFDLNRIDEIISNLKKIIELDEDSIAILIWNPHIKYFKTLKYCLSDPKIAKKSWMICVKILKLQITLQNRLCIFSAKSIL